MRNSTLCCQKTFSPAWKAIITSWTQSERCWFTFVVVRRRSVTNLSPIKCVCILLVCLVKLINKEMHFLDFLPVLCLLPMIQSRKLVGRTLGWMGGFTKLMTCTQKTGINARHLRHCYVWAWKNFGSGFGEKVFFVFNIEKVKKPSIWV